MANVPSGIVRQFSKQKILCYEISASVLTVAGSSYAATTSVDNTGFGSAASR